MNFPEKNKDIDLIERFLDGELNPDEQQYFNKRMIDDQEFKDLVEARKESSELWVKARTYSSIKEEVKRIRSQGLEDHEKKTRTIPVFISQYKYYAIAASGLLLIGIITALIFIVHPNKQNTLADNNKNKIYEVQKGVKPQEKGEMKLYNYDLNDLVKPENGAIVSRYKEIYFEWRCFNDSHNHLYIMKKGTDILVFMRQIICPKTSMQLPAGTLKPGAYSWYIADQKAKRTFIVK